MTRSRKTVPVVYFSDMLCIWAYLAQVRVDTIKANYGEQVPFETRFCSVFADSHRKITTAWKGKGAYESFNAHLRQAVERFPEIKFNPEIWLVVRPASSTSVHVFLKAAQLAEASGDLAAGKANALIWRMRCAFFQDARDISRWGVQCDVALEADIDLDRLKALIQDGAAYAALGADYQDAETMGIKGSPTFVLNEGRQKLYGNVGYRIIHANIQELLSEPNPDQASWC